MAKGQLLLFLVVYRYLSHHKQKQTVQKVRWQARWQIMTCTVILVIDLSIEASIDLR